MADRLRLPQRRLRYSETFDTPLGPVTVSFGPDADGVLREVFLDEGFKVGADMHAVIMDAMILVSLLLQYDVPIRVIADALGREGNPDETALPDAPPPPYASLIGRVVKAMDGLAGYDL